jgi:hypothetical protein
MAAEDFAILVGISNYADPAFAKLDGPPNDVALMQKWLTDPAGGNIPDDLDHIVPILSPDSFQSGVDPWEVPPRREAFEKVFSKLTSSRMALRQDRLKGRLYLYFSGHGFCSRSIERDFEAALYAANASTETNFEHMFGTDYARKAKGRALFKETVLIMDCCRVSEINRRPLPNGSTDAPDETLSPQTQLLSIYAAPKGGKAQERKIGERGDQVYGLLTHALVKALDEARPNADGVIPASKLRELLLQSWEKICGPDAPPRPEIFLPGSGDILFGARNAGGEITIKFESSQPAGSMLTLRDWTLKKVGVFSVAGDEDEDIVAQDGPVISKKRENADLVLRLQPGLYEYSLTSGTTDTIQIPRAQKDVRI